MIWVPQNKELEGGANFSHRDLILFLGINLESKLDVIESTWTA